MPRGGIPTEVFYRGIPASATDGCSKAVLAACACNPGTFDPVRGLWAAKRHLFPNGRHAIRFLVPEAAIAVASLSKSFPPARSGWRSFFQPFEKPTVVALANVSFEVREGEALALLGANGAGKSTLLRILATLLVPTQGTARVAGHDTVRQSRGVRRRLGYHAGTDHGFYPRLTTRQNLLFFGQLNQLSRAAASQRVSQLAEQFQMGDALDRQVRTLSTGTVQRLSLARALLHQPSVLLLDEPTRSLDAIAAAEFRRFLKAEILRKGKTTLLFASHTLPEVELLADRVAVIDAGRLLACDSPATIKLSTGTSSLEEAFLRLTRQNSGAARGELSA
jgi:ABC-type multidrug transport system ATPase subunit